MTDGSSMDEVRRLLERGRFYLECGLKEDALRFLDEAAVLAPEDPRVRQALARIRSQPAGKDTDELTCAFAAAYRARDWSAAAAVGRMLCAARPGDPRAWNSLAAVERRLYRFEAALDAHDQAIALGDGDAGYHRARAKTLWEAGRFDAAEAAYLDLLPRLDENGVEHADARMSLGMVRMTRDGPAAGAEDFEWRWRTGEISLPDVSQPYWDGTPQPGKRILFYGEQGFGDSVQFARFVPLIAARCGRVILPCKPAMTRLMGSLKGAPEIRSAKIARDSFDLYVPAMSAMRLFDAALESLPRDVPYLAAADEDIARLRPSIDARQGLRVGIAWTGSPTNGGDWKRSIDPALFSALGQVPGVALFSLQKVRDDTPEYLRGLPEGVTDLASMLTDFADTAAAIACLDLVVTADTSVAHLAGALGKPVWVMIPVVPDWRWMLGRDDSPWYPTVRLFRQRTFGDWAEVMARIAAGLAAYPRQGAGEKARGRGLTRLLPWRR